MPCSASRRVPARWKRAPFSLAKSDPSGRPSQRRLWRRNASSRAGSSSSRLARGVDRERPQLAELPAPAAVQVALLGVGLGAVDGVPAAAEIQDRRLDALDRPRRGPSALRDAAATRQAVEVGDVGVDPRGELGARCARGRPARSGDRAARRAPAHEHRDAQARATPHDDRQRGDEPAVAACHLHRRGRARRSSGATTRRASHGAGTGSAAASRARARPIRPPAPRRPWPW